MLRNTLSQISNSYPQEKLDFNKRYFWGTITSRLAIPFTAFYIRWQISANQVTILSLGVAVGGLIVVAMGNAIAGALLLNIWMVMDDIDGQIARTTNTASLRGRFLDNFGAYLVYAFLYPAIGLGLLVAEKELSIAGQSLNELWLLAAGLLTSVFILFYRCLEREYAKIYATNEKPWAAVPKRPAPKALPSWKRLVIWFNLNFIELAGFPLLLLMVAAAFDLLAYYLAAMFLLNFYYSGLRITIVFRSLY